MAGIVPKRLKLKVNNKAKSAVAKPRVRKFLASALLVTPYQSPLLRFLSLESGLG